MILDATVSRVREIALQSTAATVGRVFSSDRASSPPESRVHTPPNAQRILIVDNVKATRKLLRHMLQKQLGQAVDEATNGAQAMRMVDSSFRSRKTYDLIFIDALMPIMDGPTAAREIFGMGFTGRIIGFAGVGHVDADAFIASGVTIILERPIRLEAAKKLLECEFNSFVCLID